MTTRDQVRMFLQGTYISNNDLCIFSIIRTFYPGIFKILCNPYGFFKYEKLNFGNIFKQFF